MKKSKATTLAFFANAPLILSVNTLLIESARSRDVGRCNPGVCGNKTTLIEQSGGIENGENHVRPTNIRYIDTLNSIYDPWTIMFRAILKFFTKNFSNIIQKFIFP